MGEFPFCFYRGFGTLPKSLPQQALVCEGTSKISIAGTAENRDFLRKGYINGVGYTYETQVDFERLQRELSDNYIILFRAHYLVANEFDFEKYTNPRRRRSR